MKKFSKILFNLYLEILTDGNLSKPFKILDAKPVKMLLLFHPLFAEAKTTLMHLMYNCGEAYGMKNVSINEVVVDSENLSDWTKAIQQNYSKDINCVTVILDKYLQQTCHFYLPLKKHSLEISGYPMQVVLENTVHKNSMSIASNILLQINSKIGGSLFKVEMPKNLREKNLMVFGIDISCIKRTNTLNIAMCSTINADFTKYTSFKQSIKLEENSNLNNTLCLSVVNFVNQALEEFYKLNKSLPNGVIIYRQGVSKEQVNSLNREVKGIEDLLAGNFESKSNPKAYNLLSEILRLNPIKYNYILVNKKVNLKFFEKEKNSSDSKFFNPDSGLLIMNDLVDRDPSLEFYIQPQFVNSGCATPTCFQVSHGNLHLGNELPKLTYDLCYMYSNWKGPVRVPAPLKYAEKLAKTEANLCERSKNKLYHL